MIRPHNFGYNVETSETNSFQKEISHINSADILLEFDNMVAQLKDANIDVIVFDDTPAPHTPDAIFPNNWISTHDDGTVVLYSMHASNRRGEVRTDLIEELSGRFGIKRIIDLTHMIEFENFLEGTGSLVFDHLNKIIYACESPRTHFNLITQLNKELNYTIVGFGASDLSGQAVYHTNVLMSVGEKSAVVCSASIDDPIERNMVLNSLRNSGKDIVDISHQQMSGFAGNIFEVQNTKGNNCLIMSRSAHDSFTQSQLKQLKMHAEIIAVDISKIETIGGGSARCMITGIYLPERSPVS